MIIKAMPVARGCFDPGALYLKNSELLWKLDRHINKRLHGVDRVKEWITGEIDKYQISQHILTNLVVDIKFECWPDIAELVYANGKTGVLKYMPGIYVVSGIYISKRTGENLTREFYFKSRKNVDTFIAEVNKEIGSSKKIEWGFIYKSPNKRSDMNERMNPKEQIEKNSNWIKFIAAEDVDEEDDD